SKYVGRTLEFVVTAIEEGRGSAVVSRRQLLKTEEEATSKSLIATLKPGDERDGTVERLEPFGAFVDMGGVDGMVLVSEIRYERVHHPKDVLHTGQEVEAIVQGVYAAKKRVSLSIKKTIEPPMGYVEPAERPPGRRDSAPRGPQGVRDPQGSRGAQSPRE